MNSVKRHSNNAPVKKTISISLDEDVIDEIDRQAKLDDRDRSNFLNRHFRLHLRLRRDHVR